MCTVPVSHRHPISHMTLSSRVSSDSVRLSEPTPRSSSYTHDGPPLEAGTDCAHACELRLARLHQVDTIGTRRSEHACNPPHTVSHEARRLVDKYMDSSGTCLHRYPPPPTSDHPFRFLPSDSRQRFLTLKSVVTCLACTTDHPTPIPNHGPCVTSKYPNN